MLSGHARKLDRPHRPIENLPEFLRNAESEAITSALESSKGNLTHAAKLLGWSRPTLYKRVKLYAVKRKAYLKGEG